MTVVASHSIRVISWDVDGTLYSVSDLKRAIAWRLAGRALGGRLRDSVSELRALRRFYATFDRSRDVGLAPWNAHDRRRLAGLERHWYGAALRRIGPGSGVEAALSCFARRGFTQIVVSDFESHYKLEALGLARFFSGTFSGEALRRPKPDPEVFFQAARQLGVPPSDILHIGDRDDTDGESARRAGAACLLVGRDFGSFQDLLGRHLPEPSSGPDPLS